MKNCFFLMTNIRKALLKQEYEEQWLIASSEDRENAPLRLAPREFLY